MYLRDRTDNSAIEDPAGRAMALTIEHATPHPAITYAPKKIASLYPIGCVLAIKEPYVCLNVSSALPEILVTVPTDIEILPYAPGMWRFPSPVSTDLYACIG